MISKNTRYEMEYRHHQTSLSRVSCSCTLRRAEEASLAWAQADHPLLVGVVVDWNLSNDLLLFIKEIHMNNTVAMICSKLQNLKQMFQLKFEENVNWVMCHVFFAVPCCFSAILRDEYLTSAVRTKEGDCFFSSNRRGQIFILQNSVHLILLANTA